MGLDRRARRIQCFPRKKHCHRATLFIRTGQQSDLDFSASVLSESDFLIDIQVSESDFSINLNENFFNELDIDRNLTLEIVAHDKFKCAIQLV